MPHQRKRHLQSLLKRTLNYSSITGVFGHRQVGKTTLVSQFGGNYVTLDDPLRLDEANSDPMQFLKNGTQKGLMVIDECQMAPSLFPALKEWVRIHPKPGQFLLTGSVRFSSRKLIRESLTGRMIAWELLPMDLSEAFEQPIPENLFKLLHAASADVKLRSVTLVKNFSMTQEIDRTLTKGGLPGIFAIRDKGVRAQRFQTMIGTTLERDLPLILKTTLSLTTLKELLKTLALLQGQPLEWAKISRQTRISIPSLKKVIQALEALFMIRIIPAEGSEKKSAVFFEDQGEATYLTSNRYDDATQLLRFIYSQMRHSFHYRPESPYEVFQFRNRGGAYVPLCLRSGKAVLGLIPLLQENPEPNGMATARSFLKTYPNSKLLYVHPFDADRVIQKDIRSIGVQKLLIG